MGVSIGATALVARRTGEHDPEGAARAAGQSIVLGLAIAAAIALLLLVCMHRCIFNFPACIHAADVHSRDRSCMHELRNMHHTHYKSYK
jgi:hypothetical protein